MRRDGVSTFKVAATYIGTIVGAGFATGQEMLQFFIRFGIQGLFGILITITLFIIFGEIIMVIGKKVNARSYLEIIQYTGGKTVGTIIDFIIIFFLFGALTAMIAGTGALFEQQFNMPSIVGNLAMALITAITVLTGINGVITSISMIVPFLLLTVIGTSAISIIIAPPDIFAIAPMTGDDSLIKNWVLAAILFVSYNMLLAIAVLGPLGSKAKDLRTIRRGALLGCLGLGVGSIMIYLALSGNVTKVALLEVPMMYIASEISSVLLIVYAVVLVTAVYTTSIGSLYGFVSRIINLQKEPKAGALVVLGTTIAALFASQFGFSNLVKYLYPIFGSAGMVLLVSLLYNAGSNRKFLR